MITELEMGVLNQLKALCDDNLSKDIVDVVLDMFGELDNDGFRNDEESTNFVSEYAEEINNVIKDAVYTNKLPKRKIGDYEILNVFNYGDKEVFLGENLKAPIGAVDKYVVGDCVFNGLFERYENCIGCDNYNEVVELYSQRVNEQIAKVKDQLAEFPYDRSIIGKESCDSISGVNLKGKVVVVKGESIKSEYAGADRQLCLASGGFGCSPDGAGRTVFCKNLYTGNETNWHRGDILGTIKPECMPEWAKDKLAEIEKSQSVDGLIDKAKQTCEEVNKDTAQKSDVELEKEHE